MAVAGRTPPKDAAAGTAHMTPAPAPARDMSMSTTRHPLLGVAVPHGRRSGAARGQPARLPGPHRAATG